MPKQATLVLKDGTTLQGESFGADLPCAGEVVFNTGMMGYPESFTDPSYRGQILTLTYPLIGNYGIPGECKDDDNLPKHFESNKPHIRGLIVSEYSENYSHWEAKKSLADWLKKHKIPAITGIDTRALTQKLRQHGTMLGKIVQQTSKAGRVEDAKDETPFEDPNKSNLVAEVSIKKPILYKRGPKKVIAVDCGMKHNILRSLLARNLTVLKTPWDYDFIEAQRTGTLPIEDFNGIFLSNGATTQNHSKSTQAQKTNLWNLPREPNPRNSCRRNYIQTQIWTPSPKPTLSGRRPRFSKLQTMLCHFTKPWLRNKRRIPFKRLESLAKKPQRRHK